MGSKPRACKSRGQVLAETVFALTFVLLSLGFGLDVVRRAQLQMAFHHAACVGARHLVLRGGDNLEQPVREALRLFGANSSGAATGATISAKREPRKGEVTLYYRYRQFFTFPWRGVTKHHEEVSESCSFPIG